MRFPLPPSEEESWILQTYTVKTQHTQEKDQTFFLPLQKQDHLLLALRIRPEKDCESIHLEIPVSESKFFNLQIEPDTWTQLPYPIEQHAIGPVWDRICISLEEYTIELAYFPWTTRHFRMRALVDTEGEMILAYRINKKGQTVLYLPPKDHTMTLPEDTYVIPPTSQINSKSIVLFSAHSHLRVKKVPESRYFNI